jgi:O-antigen/teichoic acid export membrane protein
MDERGRMRVRRIGLTGITSLIVKGISTIISFISIPLTAKYLGAERFGLWLMLSTFLSWVYMADFGLGNSLKNVLAATDVKEEQEKAKVAVSSVFWLTASISLFLGISFYIIYPFLSWEKIFNITSDIAKSEASLAVIVVAFLFLFRLIVSIPSNIYHAYQEGYLYNNWIVISSVLSIAALIIAIIYKASLPSLVFFGFGTSLLGNIFSAFHIFIWRRPWLKPSFTYFRWNDAFSLLKIGFHFWLAQISAILLLQTDLILVAQFFGSVEVAKYGITLKLYGLINGVQMSFLNPLWTAYTEAIARQDYQWVIKIFKYSIWISMIWLIGTNGFLIIFGQKIIKIIANQEMVPEISLIWAMSLTTIIIGFTQSLAMFLNGLGEVRIQAILGLPSGIFNLIVSIILANKIGSTGICLGTSLTILLTLCVYINRIKKRLNKLKQSTINN